MPRVYDTVYGGKLHVEGLPAFTPAVEPRFGFRCLTGDSREELAQRSRDFLLLHGREPERSRNPFFLWASFINPHDICRVLPRDAGRPSFEPATLEECPPLPENFAPTRAEPRWIGRFRDATLGEESTLELGLNRRFGRSAHSWSERQWRLYRGAYRHFMADVDRQIGIVLDALREAGLERDTVVLFTSDHGDHDGEHRLTMKRSFYEAAAHVPLLVRWPGRVPAGRVDDSHLINNGIDLLPTLCDLASAAPPAGLPGRSFIGLAQAEPAARWPGVHPSAKRLPAGCCAAPATSTASTTTPAFPRSCCATCTTTPWRPSTWPHRRRTGPRSASTAPCSPTGPATTPTATAPPTSPPSEQASVSRSAVASARIETTAVAVAEPAQVRRGTMHDSRYRKCPRLMFA